MQRILLHHIVTKEHSMPYTFHLTATSSVDAGAVIGGTVACSIALMAWVSLLLGCLIYNKKRKRRRLHIRYVVIQYASLIMLVILECFIVVGGV